MLLATLLILVSGCAAVGPDYRPPEPQISDSWTSELSADVRAEAAQPETLARWWEQFSDPQLTELVSRAVAGNLDLLQAYARLREARASFAVSSGGKLPSMDASSSVTRSHSGSQSRTLYSLGFDAGWELDIFGGVHRSVEAAEANLGANREELRDLLVSLVAEVATNYFEIRTLQGRIATAEKNISLQQQSLELAEWRLQAGLTNELAVEQARTNLASTRAQLPSLEASLTTAINRLAVLLGKQPGILQSRFAETRPLPALPSLVLVGLPSETLRQRPDLRQAERQLAAANANIGVAMADLYPHFRLSGSLGLSADRLADLFTASSRTLSLGPSVNWTLFDGGRTRQTIEVQIARRDQQLQHYLSVLLSVLEEAENSITAYRTDQRRHQALEQAAESAKTSAVLALDRFRAGLSDFSAVLDAQRSQSSLEDQLAQSQGTLCLDLVRLYKSLGGGWQELAADPDQQLSALEKSHP